MGSPFYGVLLDRMADEAEAGSPIAELYAPDGRDRGASYRLRVLGGLHRMVLAGDAPELARHYPSTGGDGDGDAAWRRIRELLLEPPAPVLDALTRPPQTNEVGRSASLIGGFLLIARDTGLPLRVLELGASAGLNLQFDRYQLRPGRRRVRRPRLAGALREPVAAGSPPFATDCRVAERRGCDRDPIDPATDDGRLQLLSYVWPGQDDRFTMLKDALEIAARHPAAVDRASIPQWLAEQLAEAAPERATVVFHSVVWMYLTADEQDDVRATFRDAGERATTDAPLAWLRLESVPDLSHTELRLTTWPGGEERFLARATHHVGPIDWLVSHLPDRLAASGPLATPAKSRLLAGGWPAFDPRYNQPLRRNRQYMNPQTRAMNARTPGYPSVQSNSGMCSKFMP